MQRTDGYMRESTSLPPSGLGIGLAPKEGWVGNNPASPSNPFLQKVGEF